LDLVWEYGFDDVGITSASLGQAFRLGNGNTMVNFGSSGVLHEVDPSGNLVWEASSEFGWGFGNAAPIEDLYGSAARGE
jgi:hypothetical protein